MAQQPVYQMRSESTGQVIRDLTVVAKGDYVQSHVLCRCKVCRESNKEKLTQHVSTLYSGCKRRQTQQRVSRVINMIIREVG